MPSGNFCVVVVADGGQSMPKRVLDMQHYAGSEGMQVFEWPSSFFLTMREDLWALFFFPNHAAPTA